MTHKVPSSQSAEGHNQCLPNPGPAAFSALIHLLGATGNLLITLCVHRAVWTDQPLIKEQWLPCEGEPAP